ncbi:fumarate hydratase [Vallitalea guaymasensis]|uniref:Fumarate hydratase n=1 Tax=Vallitalea guaymasensis TaxID=1185412 RepID=A0A8J8MAG2_9FIRM|nr:fumarate hydratase [Vallitalea guaymasensis]QUH29371.1 fumarate hydratase [Vallitalea guaymasensis]
MREISVNLITKEIKEMCIEANCYVSKDILDTIKEYKNKEESPIGKDILEQIQQNAEIAKNKMMPMCQDTGMAVIFCEIGQDVHITGASITDAINEGVRQGYEEGYLRKSVVKDPFFRENTKDNTPAIIHYDIVEGDKIKITVAPKGFGSENMSKIAMLKPADGIEGAKKAILNIVEQAGGNACPPMIVGVGIGGTFEKAAFLAKKALLRPVGNYSSKEYIKDMEEELLDKINKLGIGPGGLGGRTTALAVNIETYPTHIAGLPVAVNISCHATRHSTRII